VDCAIASKKVANVLKVELELVVAVPVDYTVIEGGAIYQAVEDALDCADLP
jgi:hypothetical protein